MKECVLCKEKATVKLRVYYKRFGERKLSNIAILPLICENCLMRLRGRNYAKKTGRTIVEELVRA